MRTLFGLYRRFRPFFTRGGRYRKRPPARPDVVLSEPELTRARETGRGFEVRDLPRTDVPR